MIIMKLACCTADAMEKPVQFGPQSLNVIFCVRAHRAAKFLNFFRAKLQSNIILTFDDFKSRL